MRSGTLATIDPGERRSARALTDVRLLLVLAPWLAARHGTADVAQTQHLPANALAEPIESLTGKTGKTRPA